MPVSRIIITITLSIAASLLVTVPFRTTDLVVDNTETIGGSLFQTVSGDPNGVLTAAKGSLVLDSSTPALWQNSTGSNVWAVRGQTGSGAVSPIAAAHVDSALGVYTKQSGFVGSPVHNGAGDWTLQYSIALNTDLGIVQATVQDQDSSGQRENITVQSVDTTHIRVRTFQAAAARDQHFWITIGKIQ